MHDEQCEIPIVFLFWTRIKDSWKKETVESVGALRKKDSDISHTDAVEQVNWNCLSMQNFITLKLYYVRFNDTYDTRYLNFI